MAWRTALVISIFLNYTNQHAMGIDSLYFSEPSHMYTFTREDRTALALFPPMLGSLVELRPNGFREDYFLWSAREFSKDKNNSGLVESYLIDLCKYSDLSPETQLYVLQASQKIVHGGTVDLSDPRLKYDAEREKAHKYASIIKMPYLLRQLCKEDMNDWNVQCLLAYMMPKPLENISIVMNCSITSVDELARYINYHYKKIIEKSCKSVSPHTYVRTARQLHNLIFKHIPVPEEV